MVPVCPEKKGGTIFENVFIQLKAFAYYIRRKNVCQDILPNQIKV